MPTEPVPEALAGQRFDLAVARLGGVSRAEARRWIDAGEATLDGAARSADTKVVAGSSVTFPEFEPPTFEPDGSVTFGVLYEDDALAVVDKPAGLVTQAGLGHRVTTLASGVVARWPEMVEVGPPGRWGLVHRLDRDTSGALLVAKTSEAMASLADQLRRREVTRVYTALVTGLMEVPTGTIDAPIDRDPDVPTRRTVTPFGRPSRTHYRVTERYEASGLTRVEVRLETGRTHQIRVHFAAIDHHLVGDRVYRTAATPSLGLHRTWLHASSLTFIHPVTGEDMTVESPLPADLAATLEGLQ